MDIDFEHSLSLGGNIWKFASYREDAAERIAALYGLPAAVAEQTTLGEAAGPMMDAVEMAVERMVKMHTLKT